MNTAVQTPAPRAPVSYAVVIPVFNEEDAIGDTLAGLVAHGVPSEAEVIVVDDGSTDGTAAVVARHPVTLLKHPANKGYGAALKTGIRHATADNIIIMDSDGQHSAEDLPRVREALRTYPMVIGERAAGAHVRSRKAGKWIIRTVGEHLVEQALPDYNSGYRGFRRRLILSMLHMMPNGFSFSTTSTLAFLKQGYSIATVPITVTPRVGRRSTVRPLRDGVRTLMLLMRIIMLFNPMKIFLPTSVVFGLWGFALGLYDIWANSRLSNGSLVLMVFAMFLFFFGLLADQISVLNLREQPHEAP